MGGNLTSISTPYGLSFLDANQPDCDTHQCQARRQQICIGGLQKVRLSVWRHELHIAFYLLLSLGSQPLDSFVRLLRLLCVPVLTGGLQPDARSPDGKHAFRRPDYELT